MCACVSWHQGELVGYIEHANRNTDPSIGKTVYIYTLLSEFDSILTHTKHIDS